MKEMVKELSKNTGAEQEHTTSKLEALLSNTTSPQLWTDFRESRIVNRLNHRREKPRQSHESWIKSQSTVHAAPCAVCRVPYAVCATVQLLSQRRDLWTLTNKHEEHGKFTIHNLRFVIIRDSWFCDCIHRVKLRRVWLVPLCLKRLCSSNEKRGS